MALSIKTEEADRLARELATLTGETITEAVTVALRERCERERSRPATPEDKLASILAFAEEFRAHLTDPRPMTKADWDEASGDTD
jgi:antitoxin VapB